MAWDPIGIGDTWTGIAIPILTVAAISFGFILRDMWETRRWRNSSRYDAYDRRPVTRGTVICDWVDLPVLTSIARQKSVAPEPVRVERGEGTTTSGSLDARPKGIGARIGRERRDDVKEFYELTQDPNALLVKVLGKIADDGHLADDLDESFGAVAFSGDTLDEMIRAAKQSPELEAARQAIRTLQETATQERILDRWRFIAQEPKFALVESTWRVDRVGDDVYWMALTKLRQGEYPPGPGYGNPPEVPTLVDIPGDMALVAKFDPAKLTDSGKGRLVNGSRDVRAAVFGMTANLDEEHNNLWITPIAVFARIES
ncbi:MAG TPA: hypothetical protein VGM33_21380 [Baekduia sp.]|jgi:hypothetical protein